MTPFVRAQALKSAAKVAFSAAILGGCAAETLESTGEAELASSVSACETKDAGKPNADSGVKAPKDSGVLGADSGVRDCHALVKALFDQASAVEQDSGTFTDWEAEANANPELASCCDELIKDDFGLGPNAFPVGAEREVCCTATRWMTGGACTPWGPPVPPKMKARRARRETVRAQQAVA